MQTAPVQMMPDAQQAALGYATGHKAPGWTPMFAAMQGGAAESPASGPAINPFFQAQEASPFIMGAMMLPSAGLLSSMASGFTRGPEVLRHEVDGRMVPKIDPKTGKAIMGKGSLMNRGLKGIVGALSSAPVHAATALVTDLNPYIAYKGYKNTKNYVQSGRAGDQAVGIYSPSKKSRDKVAHMDRLLEVRESIPFEHSVDLSRGIFEKTSSAKFRSLLRAIRGVDSPSDLKAGKGLLGGLTDPPEVPKTFREATFGKLKDYTTNDRQGLPKSIALLGLGIPAASLGLSAADKVTDVIGDKYNSLLANKRFGRALDKALESPDVQFELSRGGAADDNIIGKLRNEFKVLNKYAPTVAKDPNIGSAFLESMVYRHAASGSASEYVNNVKAFADLESRIKTNKPSVNHQALRYVL